MACGSFDRALKVQSFAFWVQDVKRLSSTSVMEVQLAALVAEYTAGGGEIQTNPGETPYDTVRGVFELLPGPVEDNSFDDFFGRFDRLMEELNI
jgi:hypothetical protein